MDYEFIEVSIGSNSSRNLVVNRKDILRYVPKSNIPVFVSTFLYSENLFLFVNKTGSVADYRGDYTADYIFFDIDRKGNLTLAISDLRELIKYISSYLPKEYLSISFSGSKGFHVGIPAAAFGGFSPSPFLAYIFKHVAAILSPIEVDAALYKPMMQLRMRNTINEKSGLFKVQIYPDEIDSLTEEYLREIAKAPRDYQNGVDHKAAPLIKEWQAIYKQAIEKASERSQEFEIAIEDDAGRVAARNGGVKPCIFKMLGGVQRGQGITNEVMCRLVSHFRWESGLTKTAAWGAIQGWNSILKPPLERHELLTTFNSVWNHQYKYNCSDDPLSRKFCTEPCVREQAKPATSEVKIKRITDLVDGYRSFARDPRWIKTDINGIDDAITGFRAQDGNTACILGRPTAFKSTLAIKIGQNISKQHDVLYISLEMGDLLFFERMSLPVLGINANELRTVFANGHSQAYVDSLIKEYPRFHLTTQSGITPMSIKEIVGKMRDEGKNVEVVFLDYIGIMQSDSGYKSATEHLNSVIMPMKAIAKSEKFVVVFLAHARGERSSELDLYKPLTIGSGKDTSRIENDTDFLFGVHLLKDVKAVNVQILKNKHGSPNFQGFPLFHNGTLSLVENTTNPDIRASGTMLNQQTQPIKQVDKSTIIPQIGTVLT